MEQSVSGRVRLELHQKVLAAKICSECHETNPWDATHCTTCGAPLPEGVTVKEDRGLVASSEEGGT